MPSTCSIPPHLSFPVARILSLLLSWLLAVWMRLVRLAEELEGQLDPFDDTRVHPECYNTQDWAQRICANALDVQVKT